MTAAYMNHLERIGSVPRPAPPTGFARPHDGYGVIPGAIPGFMRADNRRDDQYEQIPGLLRRLHQQGGEFTGWGEWFDASPQQRADKVKLTDDEIEVLRGRALFEVAHNDICAEFLEKIAEITLGKKVTASELLNEGIDRVKNTLGFHWADYAGAGGVATGHKIGSPHEKLGEIWLPTNKKDTMAPYVSVGFIPEVVHVAARANDKDLSEAVNALGIEVILDSGKIMEYPKDENNDKLAFSGYWGQALKNHCGPGTINRQFVP